MSHSDSELSDALKVSRYLRTKFKTKRDKNKMIPLRLKLMLQSEYQEKLLINAVSAHDIAEVNRLLDLGVSANTTDSSLRSASALHIAVIKGYTDIVELLLRRGADPNKRDSLGTTPLHLASGIQSIPIITLLIYGGACTHYLDAQGRHPLDLAFSKISMLKTRVRDENKGCLRIHDEVKNYVDLLMAFIGPRDLRQAKVVRSAITRQDIDELEFMKLSLSDKPNHELDDDISKLLNGIEKFKIM